MESYDIEPDWCEVDEKELAGWFMRIRSGDEKGNPKMLA